MIMVVRLLHRLKTFSALRWRFHSTTLAIWCNSDDDRAYPAVDVSHSTFSFRRELNVILLQLSYDSYKGSYTATLSIWIRYMIESPSRIGYVLSNIEKFHLLVQSNRLLPTKEFQHLPFQTEFFEVLVFSAAVLTNNIINVDQSHSMFPSCSSWYKSTRYVRVYSNTPPANMLHCLHHTIPYSYTCTGTYIAFHSGCAFQYEYAK